MADKGRMAVFHGAGKPFEIREYPVPEPEPGAMLIEVALANVCGSDLHYWRGELDYVKMGRPLPLNTGHEHVGRVAKLGPGVTTDSAGQPLSIGDRVAYRFFFPCGRCRACLMRKMARTLTKYPWDRVVSHKYPLEAINEAFAEQDKGHVTRAAIVPR